MQIFDNFDNCNLSFVFGLIEDNVKLFISCIKFLRNYLWELNNIRLNKFLYNNFLI